MMLGNRSPTSRAGAPRRLGWPLRILFGLLALAAVTTPFVDSEVASSILAAAALSGLSSIAVLLITRSRRLELRERNAWRLLGIGMAIGASGIAIHATIWLLGTEVPVFGPIDTIWLTGYLIGIAGLARLPHAAGSKWQRARLLLDGLIGAVAVASLLWTLVLRELTDELAAAGFWEGFVGSTYVILDTLVLVIVMIVVVRRSTYRFDPRLVLFTLGAVALGVADISFLTKGLGKSFAEAEPLYPVTILAVMLFLTAAVNVDRQPAAREYADRTKTPAWAMVLPYGSAAAMVTLLIARAPGGALPPGQAGLVHATVTIGALVIARQAVAIRENRRMVEDQQTALVSSISHELRTPLTAMVGFLELLDSGVLEDADEREEVTAIVNQQAAYLSRIVTDLVMLASENINTMELQVEAVPVDSLAWAAVNTAAIDPTSVIVDTQRGVTAFVDSGRMQQALANLLTNADRYGGDRVLVVAKAEGGNLILEIHDNGAGVPRRYELLIWQRFERGTNRLNSAIPGSGIGLAITNAIAAAHGGTAGYRRSDRLGGACFWIRLPGRVHGHESVEPSGSSQLTVLEPPGRAQTA